MELYVEVTKKDNHDLRLVVGGVSADFVDRYKVLLRPDHGDTILKTGFEASSWSLMRLFRIIQMDSRDDDDLGIAEKASNIITDLIKNWQSTSRTPCSEHREGCRLQRSCQRNFELGGLALQLGGEYSIPLKDRKYLKDGRLELTYLRTFYLSPENPHVVYLEFELDSDRDLQSRLHGYHRGPIPKVVIALDDEQRSFTQEMESKCVPLEQEPNE